MEIIFCCRVGTRRYMAPEILDNTLKLDSFESFKVLFLLLFIFIIILNIIIINIIIITLTIVIIMIIMIITIKL